MKHISIKKAIIILLFLAAVGVAVVYGLTLKSKANIEYTTALVERGQLIQTVSETGTVKAANELSLGFLSSGKIAKINFKLGDAIKAGDLITELDTKNLEISRDEAEANYDAANQTLHKLLAGATTEERAVAQAGVNQSQAAYDAAVADLAKVRASVAENIRQAEKTLSDLELSTENDLTTYEQSVIAARSSLENIKISSQNTIDNYKETAFTVLTDKLIVANAALGAVDRVINDEAGKDYIGLKNQNLIPETRLLLSQGLSLLVTAETSLAEAKNSNTNDSALAAVDNTLIVINKTADALASCYSALDASLISSNFSQANLDALKTTITSHQTLISAALTAVKSARQNLDNSLIAYETNVAAAQNSLLSANAAYDNALNTAKNTLETVRLNGDKEITSAESRVKTAKEALGAAQAQLRQATAAPNDYDEALYRAKIRQAQAAINSINQQIENSRIKVPIDGTLVKLNYEIGEQAIAGSQVASILGENNLEIELLISEADIAKVKKEGAAEITFDAFGSDLEFNGQVIFIEPAETVIQDVVYYKVKIEFDPRESEIKPGMTANAVITTSEKSDILIIPARAVVEKNGDGRFIRVLSNGLPIEKKITIGLRGDGGMIEVLSGVNEGEEVVTYVKEK